MQRKRNVIFLISSIKSHIIPCSYVADLLRDEYDSTFLVDDPTLEKLVQAQGYNAEITSNLRACVRMEGEYLGKKDKPSFMEIVKCILNDDIYNLRKEELSVAILRLRPVAIFVDIFNSTDVIPVYDIRKDIPIILLNPMLSTYKVEGFPSVNDDHWPNSAQNAKKVGVSIHRFFRISYYRSLFFNKLFDYQFNRSISRSGLRQQFPVSTNLTHALLFDGMPEVVLAPLEFEVSATIRKGNQLYLGLCVCDKRHDLNVDTRFNDEFVESIRFRRKLGKKIVYCSFGTFYEGSDKKLLKFITDMIEALSFINDVEVIFSVNSFVIQAVKFQKSIPDNIYLFNGVPQLQVLSMTDLFITHGGLGSIKEAISYSVPMLVYPLDPNYDQPGNALKIEHHKIGIKGRHAFETKREKIQKINEILNNPLYYQSVSLMSREIQKKYSRNYQINSIKRLVTNDQTHLTISC